MYPVADGLLAIETYKAYLLTARTVSEAFREPHRANKSCGAQDALAVGSAVKKASFEKFFKKIKRFIDTSEMISFSWFGVKYGYVKLEQIYMVGFSFIMRISLK